MLYEIIPNDIKNNVISFGDDYEEKNEELSFRSGAYKINASSNETDKNNAFLNNNLNWKSNPTFKNPDNINPAAQYPTFTSDIDLSMHENGEFIEIELPYYSYITNFEIHVPSGSGEIRNALLLGGYTNMGDSSSTYEILKVIGDYSVLLKHHDESGKYQSDILFNEYLSSVSKPYIIEIKDSVSGKKYYKKTYDSGEKYFKTYQDAALNIDDIIVNRIPYINPKKTIQTHMQLGYVMDDNVTTNIDGSIKKYKFNINAVKAYHKYRLVISQIQNGDSAIINNIFLKGRITNFYIKPYESHLEHFANYKKQNAKKSVHIDESKNNIYFFTDENTCVPTYSNLWIPGILVSSSLLMLMMKK